MLDSIINVLFEALPNEPVAIAKFLTEKGIKGDRSRQASCPIANYFMASGMFLRCRARRFEIDFSVGDASYSQYTISTERRAGIIEFMAMFDDGAFPELEVR